MKKFEINADLCHEYLVTQTRQQLAFNPDKDLEEQRVAVREKLTELMGIDRIALNACAENFFIESEEIKDGYKQIRFIFESEKNNFVPCYLLIPTTGKEKYPVAITLQGHAKGGMANSIGVEVPEEPNYQPRGAYAIQAVQNGFAALCIELRGMWGELQPKNPVKLRGECCQYTAFSALVLGRTLIGERCWDVFRAIDLLPKFSGLDTDNIVITGSSGGGTMSYYAACLDERIKFSVPSCAFCSLEQSILNCWHCPCNYIPNMYNYFDMQDLAVLISPRRLTIVNGAEDAAFTIDGAKKAFETVKAIYEKAGVPDNCKLIVTPNGHYWRDDIVWESINEMFK